jgi:hypothetical protein
MSQISQAARIIKLFGGINPLARALNLKPSIVQGWKERGFIPARRQDDVMKKAIELEIPLKAEHFFPSLDASLKKNLIGAIENARCA